MRRLLIFAALILTLSMPIVVLAQSDETTLPPTNYGAGYKIIIFHNHQEHAPGPNDDLDGDGPIELDMIYPQISALPSPNVIAFNDAMKDFVEKKWGAIGGPKDNSVTSDPSVNYSLDCEPIGLQLPVDATIPPNSKMLPGVISAGCGGYILLRGAAHGGGEYWGFNWIVDQRRALRAGDVFNVNTKWLIALTNLVNADRGPQAASLQTLDFSDTSHWVVS